MKKRIILIQLFVITIVGISLADSDSTFISNFPTEAERVWPGPEYWTNPMEDWRLSNGCLECISGGGNRNVHILTRELANQSGDFEISVQAGLIEKGNDPGSVGFRIGIQDQIDDYRSRCFRGGGIDAGLTTDGKLFIQNQSKPLNHSIDLKSVKLTLTGKQAENGYTLTLTAMDQDTNESIGVITQTKISPNRLVGNIAVVNNHDRKIKNGPRFRFSDWTIRGDKIAAHEDRRFGPILWSMHTLSRKVMKMTAQMPPIGPNDAQTVRLQIQNEGEWETIGEAKIDPDARTATFRIADWDDTKDTPYRLLYAWKESDGVIRDEEWSGVVRKNPTEKEILVVSGLCCQTDEGFPHLELTRNVEIHNPDLLFFAGDQIYESVGGYGIIRTPADRSILNYLRKFYMFGWAFRDLMRDRVTLCLPDDHDVFQGNLWGNSGNAVSMEDHDAGGYAQPAQMVNAVHRTNTSHHPDFYDPTPIQQNISVYYGDMIYGGVSFAIVADRMFKSGPKETVATWPGRPDHVQDSSIDVTSLDKAGLILLGERQLSFLRDWAGDWRESVIKCLLSQTTFCNVATNHGEDLSMRLYADLDSNGWPQSGRNEALDIIRRAFAFHLCGDQHLPTLVQHGIDEFHDAGWAFCVPAISVGYPRAWRPDELGIPHSNRPAHGLPNTGDYLDCLNNLVTVYAVGNPEKQLRTDSRIHTLHDKSSGYGIIRFDKKKREIVVEAWKLIFDAANPRPVDQFPGWPKTIPLMENYGREAVAWLPTLRVSGMIDPVVQVIDESTNEIVYTLRINGTEFRPKVFKKGLYRVKIGEPSIKAMKTINGLESIPAEVTKIIDVKFD
ncbi:MAG: twin-arginine translocation pathway signal [Candidatus Omnitrophota bacterium]|jgi:hypothetical protein|nr:MAG: twin-arginine translocation pathway signal [Candidatus Omnitrophota bacterium]